MVQEVGRRPGGLLGRAGKRLDWIKPFTKVKDVSFQAPDVHIRWFYDGTLNVSQNCLDRHLAKRGDQTAILFEGDDPSVSKAITYRELHEQVCRFANVLKGLGVKKGDRVTHLPADDPGAGGRDARLHPHRRHPLDRLRRLLPGLARQPHPGLRTRQCWSPPTRACAAAARFR